MSRFAKWAVSKSLENVDNSVKSPEVGDVYVGAGDGN